MLPLLNMFILHVLEVFKQFQLFKAGIDSFKVHGSVLSKYEGQSKINECSLGACLQSALQYQSYT